MGARHPALTRRLILAASGVLAAFLGLTGIALDRGFRSSAEAAVKARLEAVVYGLLAVAELAPDGTPTFPGQLPEPRLSAADSGLYAAVWGGDAVLLWTSPSALGQRPPPPPAQRPGIWHFTAPTPADPWFGLSMAVRWENGSVHHYRYQVREDPARFAREVNAFRGTLWAWLGGALLLLLGAQAVVLHAALSPLRRLDREVRSIRAGTQQGLEGPYPREVAGLAAGLNDLLAHQREHLARYRDRLADLAHSLKTPLAVIRGVVDGESLPDRAALPLREETARLQATVDYHLQRAGTAGRRPLAAATPVGPVVDRLARSLDKVYREKAVEFHARVPAGAQAAVEEGDLTEMLGNLLDNAWKWSRGAVFLSLQPAGQGGGVDLEVADDGPGVDPARRAALGTRGHRGDPAVPGHGIGLAVVRDLVEAYGGEVVFGSSEQGGLRVAIHLPGPG